MSYLYGDSTPSALKINFIDFLRDVVDCAVQILGADRHIREGAHAAGEHKKAGDAEVARLEALGVLIARAIDGADLGEAGMATSRCAESILRSSADLVAGEIDRVRAHASSEVTKIDAQAARERANCVQALQTLLQRHDLPDWAIDLKLEQAGGTGYSARLHATAPFGLEVALALEIASGHALAHVLRVDKLMERLEVQAPEGGGWLRKEVKLRPQRLEKEFVTELHMKEGETTIKLRANADGTGAGCDLTMKPPRVLFVRAGDNDPTPFELADADAQRIIELQEKLVAAAADLAQSRKELIEARLDGTPLGEHPEPRLLVERLIQTIAPTVQEIGKRSLSPTELVLKRQLDSGRREEIFISRDELRAKLAPLTDAQRPLFAPLGLAEAAVPAPPVPWKPSPSSLIPKAEFLKPKGNGKVHDDEETAIEVIPAMIDDTPEPVTTELAKPK